MSTAKYTPRLQDKYAKDVIPALMKKCNADSKAGKDMYQPWC